MSKEDINTIPVLIPIIFLSAILVSIIKSITACFIYSDKMFLKTNEINDMDEEEQFNNTLIKIMSKNIKRLCRSRKKRTRSEIYGLGTKRKG